MTPANPRKQRSASRRKGRKNGNMVSQMVRADKISNPEPPTFDGSHRYSKRLRFLVTAALNNYQINASDMANLLLVANDNSGTAVICSAVWSRVRLRTVHMWATASALTSPASLELTFLDPVSSLGTNIEQTISDTAKSIDQYAHVQLSPRLGSTADLWQNSTTTGAAFSITCPQGTIIDLTLDVFLNNDDPVVTVNAYDQTNSGPWLIPPGTLFMNYLDPSPSGANPGFIQPVGYLSNATSPTSTARPL